MVPGRLRCSRSHRSWAVLRRGWSLGSPKGCSMDRLWNWTYYTGVIGLICAVVSSLLVSAEILFQLSDWKLGEGSKVTSFLGQGGATVFFVCSFILIVPSLRHLYRADIVMERSLRFIFAFFIIFAPYIVAYLYFRYAVRGRLQPSTGV